MRNTSGVISNQKPKSLGLSQIHNFSNYNPALKSRTQYGTPHMLSPPPQANIRSTSNKMGMDGGESQDENERNLEAYLKSQLSKANEQKKQFVSMDELLGFLKYINQRPGDAFKTESIPLEQINEQTKNKNKLLTKQGDFSRKVGGPTFGGSERNPSLQLQNSLKSIHDGDDDGSQQGSPITDTKKKLNKNRAIKRIIETAFDLLQKNYHFTSNQQQSMDNERSTSTQFNIYLKQYNRIIEQINSKQFEEQLKYNRLYEQNEDQLQEVFEYTVMDDFREKLSVMFTKEKVSKNNVNIMISAFREALVMLKTNEMKVEFLQSQQPVKSFKMSEIQNVEYFTHPYIFIVLTINKDKNKSKQHLYLKFVSQQNQNKWDRALYCCYMNRKMKKKSKLFEIQFPVQDVMKKEKEEYTKEDEEYIFNDDLHVVDKCFRQIPDTHSLTSNYPTYDVDGQRNLISDRSQYMNATKNRNLTEENIKISIHNPDHMDDARRLNTVQNKSSKYDNPFKNLQLNTGAKNKEDFSNNEQMGDSTMSFGNIKKTKSNHGEDDIDTLPPQSSPMAKQPNIFTPNQAESQQSMQLSKKSTFNMNTNEPSSQNKNYSSPPVSQHGSEPPLNKSTNPFMRLLKVAENESQKEKQQKQEQNKKQAYEQALRNDKALNERMQKLKRIREIQKGNVRGIVCQKEKFFMNKEKIIFFHDENLISSARKGEQNWNLETVKNISSKQFQGNKFLQYWDYDYKKDVKEERKLIAVDSIIDYQMLPSQLGQMTTTLVVSYEWVNQSKKVDKKQLRLIFANSFTSSNTMDNNKAQEIFQWIRLVKGV